MRLFKPLCFSILNMTFKNMKMLLYYILYILYGRLLAFCTSQTILFFKFDIMHVNEALTSPSPTSTPNPHGKEDAALGNLPKALCFCIVLVFA